MNDTIAAPQRTPLVIYIIAGLMLLTIFRAQTILFIPELEMFGGIAPDGWFGPWVSDFIIGLLVPVMVFLVLRSKSIKIWGLIVLYNALGAFDYSHGLITQWISPMPEAMASQATVYAGIGLFMVCQLIALGLLFRSAVVHHFIGDTRD
ncbi:MAG: hypothetical protein AAF636_13745 [Pseudomonadota bacterium]